MANKGKTLFVSDLDGTLMGADSHVSPASARMLNAAIERGALFTVATARTPATVHALLKDVDIRLPEVVMTGSTLWNPADGKYSHTHYIDPDVARHTAGIYRRLNLPTFIYKLTDKIEIYHFGDMTPCEKQFADARLGNPFKRFASPDKCAPDGMPLDFNDILIFYAMRPDREVVPVHNELKGNPALYPVFYHDLFGEEIAIMEVFSHRASKADAVRTVAEITGAERIVAYGDNLNDLPMLKAADVAVAVENAVPEVIEAADIVIGPNTADSVARHILDNI